LFINNLKYIKESKLKFIKYIFIALIFTSVTSQVFAQFSSPESVTYDSVSNRYFISNTSSSKIMQRDRNNVVTDFVTVGGSIHGVTVYNNKVYVCNGTRVRGYDLTTAAEVFNVLISGSAFLNDLTADANGTLYVSDFSGRRIYKVNTATQEYWIYVPNTTNTPNGVYVDAPRNRLLICCWGASAPVRQVNFADSVISTIITTPYSNCDGISLDRFNNVYISTWGIQSVVRYDINFSGPAVVVATALSNPADIYVNKRTDTLAIPNAGNNTVVFSKLEYPSAINQVSGEIPNSFSLKQNYPNPFNPNTIISFSIPVNVKSETSNVKLIIYNSLGKIVYNLVNENRNAGSYEVNFDGSNLSSGVYFYSLIINGNTVATKSMILMK